MRALESTTRQSEDSDSQDAAEGDSDRETRFGSGPGSLLWGPRVAVLVATMENAGDSILQRDEEDEWFDQAEADASAVNEAGEEEVEGIAGTDSTMGGDLGANDDPSGSKSLAFQWGFGDQRRSAEQLRNDTRDAIAAIVLFRAAHFLRFEFGLGHRTHKDVLTEPSEESQAMLAEGKGTTRVGLRAVLGMMQAGEARLRPAVEQW